MTRGPFRSVRLAAAGLLVGAFVAACGGDDGRAHLARAIDDLRAGRLRDASDAADRAAAAGDEAVRVACDVVRGNVAFGRSLLLEAEAAAPGAPPASLELSLAMAEDALAAWRAAAATGDVPVARRNVERGLLRVDALRARLGRKRDGSRPPPPGPGKPPPTDAPETDVPPLPKPPVAPPTPPPAAPPSPIVTTDLPAADVRGLLEVLRRKEQEKRAIRRARTTPPPAGAGDDW